MGRRARGWGITVGLFGAAALACAPGESVAVPGEPAPAPGESMAVPDAAQPDTATASPVPPELQGVVQPWQRVDPAWLARASVWVIARYTSDTYPCRPGPDGSLDMILRDAFAPTRVLRGVVKAPSIDLDLMALRGPEFPAAPGEGRSYLLLLRPNAATAARLADPAGQLNMHERLGPDQVVAIIDLSQSADEVTAESATASRSGVEDGQRFDPTLWAAARAATTITAAQHEPIARFIAARLLRARGMPLAEARRWLGAPDVQTRVGERTLIYRYWLARTQYTAPVAGGVYGQVELEFQDQQLARGAVSYFRWRFKPREQSSIAIPADELRRLGLIWGSPDAPPPPPATPPGAPRR